MSTATATFRAVADFSDLRRQAGGLNQEFNRLGQQKLGAGMSRGLGEVAKSSDTAGKSLSHLSRTGIPAVNSQLGKSTTIAQGAQKAFQGVSNAAGNMLGNISPAAGAAGSLAASLGTVGSAAAVAVVSVGALAAGVLALGVAFNAQREQAKIAFTTILKDGAAAEDILQRITKTAAATPFEQQNLIDATRKLTAYGFDIDRVLHGAGETATGLVVTIGNAVAAVGGSQDVFQRVTVALGQMKTRGKIAGDELRQLAENGIPVYEILREELGLTAEQVATIGDQGISATEGIDALARGLDKRFGGAMTAQSKTFIGLISTIKDNFQILAGAASLGIFDRLKTAIQGIGDALQSMATDAGEIGILESIRKRSPEAAQLIEALQSAFMGLTRIVQGLMPAFMAFSEVTSKTTMIAFSAGIRAIAVAFEAIASIIDAIPAPLLSILGTITALTFVGGKIMALTGFFVSLGSAIADKVLPKLLATNAAVGAIGTTEVGTNVARGMSGIGVAAGGAVSKLSAMSLAMTGLSLGPLAAVVGIGAAVVGLSIILSRHNKEYLTTEKAAEKLGESLGLELNPELIEVSDVAIDAAHGVDELGTAINNISVKEFTEANQDMIRQLQDIRDEFGAGAAQEYLVTVGVQLVMQGATPEAALASIQIAAEQSGITLPVNLDPEDLTHVESVIDDAASAVQRLLVEIEPLDEGVRGALIGTRDAFVEFKSGLENLYDTGRYQEAIAALAEFEAGIRKSNLSQRDQENIIAAAARAMIELDNSLIKDQSLENVSDLSEYLRELATTATYVPPEMKAFAQSVVEGLDAGLSFGEAYEAAGGEMRDFTAATEPAGEAVEDLTVQETANKKVIEDGIVALQEQIAQRKENVAAIGEEIARMEESAAKLQEEAAALLAMNDARRSLVDSQFASNDAFREFSELSAGATQAIAENQEGLFGVREIMDSAAQAALSYADAQIKIAQEQAAAEGTVLSATEILDRQNLILIGLAQNTAPEVSAAIGEMITTMNGIPEERKTEFIAALQAGDLETVTRLLDEAGVARDVTVTAQAKTDEANQLLTDVTVARFAEIVAQAFVDAAETLLEELENPRYVEIQAELKAKKAEDDALALILPNGQPRTAPVVAAAETTDASTSFDALGLPNGQPRNAPFVATATTAPAASIFDALRMPNGNARTAPFIGTTDLRQASTDLDRFTQQTRYVTIRARGINIPIADGGIFSFAKGGLKPPHSVWSPAPNIDQLPPSARIQKPGTLVQWAEPETGGEAFIPLSPAKRTRSLEIWRQTGKILGALRMARGGLRGIPAAPDFVANEEDPFGWESIRAIQTWREGLAQQATDNIYQANFDAAPNMGKIQLLRLEMEELANAGFAWTDAWVSSKSQIESIQKGLADAIASQADRLRSLIQQENALDKQRTEIHAKYVEARADLTQEYQKDQLKREEDLAKRVTDINKRLTESIEDRADAVLHSMSASERFTAGFAASAATTIRNLLGQNKALGDFRRAMESLRQKGLSDDDLSILGISSVKDLAAANALLKATPQQIGEITSALAERRRQADMIAENGAGDLRETATEDIATATAEKTKADLEARTAYYKELQELNWQVGRDMEVINARIRELGNEGGMTYAAAIAEGMSTGSTYIYRAAAELRRQIEEAQALGTNVSTANSFHSGGVVAGRGSEVIAKLVPGEGVLSNEVMDFLVSGNAFKLFTGDFSMPPGMMDLSKERHSDSGVPLTQVAVFLDSEEISARVVKSTKRVSRRETLQRGLPVSA